MFKNQWFICLSSLFIVLGIGCTENYTPKPNAYPRMVFPEKTYQTFDGQGCPFSFDVPVYANVKKEPEVRIKNLGDRCWMNIVFDELNARIYLSYKEIGGSVQLDKLLEDAHKLTSKHGKKAEYIDQRNIATTNGIYGLFSDIGGNAASSTQFYVTDSTAHYLYGALYFDATPNFDSIRPAVEFLKEDMLHMINTFQWQ